VVLTNPGTPGQTVTRLPVGTQLDDTMWTTGLHGRLLVSDASDNAIYTVRVDAPPGTVITETPDDSGVAGLLGTVDMKTGTVHPAVIEFGKPTGLAYIPG
jgi:hypothetical protein